MGRETGKLAQVWPVIIYSLSPLEQRAFLHYFSKGIPNMLHCIQASILCILPTTIVFILSTPGDLRSLEIQEEESSYLQK